MRERKTASALVTKQLAGTTNITNQCVRRGNLEKQLRAAQKSYVGQASNNRGRTIHPSNTKLEDKPISTVSQVYFSRSYRCQECQTSCAVAPVEKTSHAQTWKEKWAHATTTLLAESALTDKLVGEKPTSSVPGSLRNIARFGLV